jgi:hypothetical protein
MPGSAEAAAELEQGPLIGTVLAGAVLIDTGPVGTEPDGAGVVGDPAPVPPGDAVAGGLTDVVTEVVGEPPLALSPAPHPAMISEMGTRLTSNRRRMPCRRRSGPRGCTPVTAAVCRNGGAATAADRVIGGPLEPPARSESSSINFWGFG